MLLSKRVGTTNSPLNAGLSFKPSAALLLVGLFVAPLSYAHHHENAGHQNGHDNHQMTQASDVDSPAVAAYKAANDQMHEDMSMSFTGNPNIDFAQGMIPHHEGAIAMAEIMLEYGEDEEMRQLAEEIIATQESEIAILREWLSHQEH